MIQKDDKISIRKQCHLLGISRSTHYYEPKEEEKDAVYEAIIETYKRRPMYGYRRIRQELLAQNTIVNGKKILRIMRKEGICAIFPAPKTTTPDRAAYKYPYLLKNTAITKPHDVWEVDITYIKTPQGHLYLTALIDVYSRFVVGYSLSNTLSTDSCLIALDRAMQDHPVPTIINSDQGCQFTSQEWVQMLQKHGIHISMCGKGRSNDNAHIERLWRTLKYEWLYIYGAKYASEIKEKIHDFVLWYNHDRWHQALNYCTPARVLKEFCAEIVCENVENSSNLHTIPQTQQQLRISI